MLLKFIINSREVELEAGWEALDSLIDHLPDDDPALADAFAVLAQSPISTVRRAVAQKNAITDETVAVLACDPTPEVIDEVVSRHRERISEPALGEIIARKWSYMNRGVAAQAVIYSMTSSSGDACPRGLEFLFNPNRLNVALSRAQVLAIVVAGPQITRVRCLRLEQMRLVNLFCRAVEAGTVSAAAGMGMNR